MEQEKPSSPSAPTAVGARACPLWALYLKEARAYFNTPVAYIISIVFLLIIGYMTARPMFLIGQATVAPMIELSPLLLTFFVPAVTMRLFAEEQKAGTIELLQTLPVEDRHIVAAKFLSAITLLWATLLLTLGFPFALSRLGNVDWGATAVGYLGLLLASGMLAAIGTFASALTRSQVVAFIIGFGFSFVLYLIGKVEGFVPPWLTPVTTVVGLDSHLANMGRGVLDTRDLVYFLSVTGLFLFLTLLKLQTQRSD